MVTQWSIIALFTWQMFTEKSVCVGIGNTEVCFSGPISCMSFRQPNITVTWDRCFLLSHIKISAFSILLFCYCEHMTPGKNFTHNNSILASMKKEKMKEG